MIPSRFCLVALGIAFGASLGGLGAAPLQEGVLRAQIRQGETEAVLGIVRKRLREDPSDAVAHLLEGEILAKAGKSLEAFSAFRNSMGLHPEDPRALRGVRELRKEALGAIKEALLESPAAPRPRHVLAFYAILAGRGDQGLRELKKVQKARPDYAPAWHDQAWLHLAKEEPDAAFPPMRRAFELDPGNLLVRRHFELVRRARSGEDLGLGGDPFYGALAGLAPAKVEPKPPLELIPPAARPKLPSKALPESEALAQEAPDFDSVARTLPETRFDFGKVPLESDPMAKGVLERLEARLEEGGTNDPVPTPLEVIEKLEAARNRARRALEEFRFRDAETHCQTVLAFHPEDPVLRSLLRQANRGQEQNQLLADAQSALEGGDFQKALVLLPNLDPSWVERVHPGVDTKALEGRAYMLAKQPERAKIPLQLAIARTPRDLSLRHLLFQAHCQTSSIDSALEELAQISAIDPEFARSQPGFRRTYLRLLVRRYIFFLSLAGSLWIFTLLSYLVFARRRRLGYDAYGALMGVANEALHRGEPEVALEALTELESHQLSEEREIRRRLLRMTVLVALEEADQVRTEIVDFRREFPHAQGLDLVEGRLALAEGRVDPETLPKLRALLRAEPSHPQLLRVLHEHFQSEGQFDQEAEEILERLLILDPDQAVLLERMSNFYLRSGRTDEVVELHFRRTLEFSPDSLAAQKGLSRCLLARDENLEVLKLAKAYLQREPEDTEMLGVVAHAYRTLELEEEGAEYLASLAVDAGERAESLSRELAQDRDRRQRQEASAREDQKSFGRTYQQGVQSFQAGRYQEALGLLESVRESASFGSHSTALVVRCHLALGNVAEALGVFRKLSLEGSLDPFLLELSYDLAVALEAQESWGEAREIFRLVLKNRVDYRDAFERLEAVEEQWMLSQES